MANYVTAIPGAVGALVSTAVTGINVRGTFASNTANIFGGIIGAETVKVYDPQSNTKTDIIAALGIGAALTASALAKIILTPVSTTRTLIGLGVSVVMIKVKGETLKVITNESQISELSASVINCIGRTLAFNTATTVSYIVIRELGLTDHDIDNPSTPFMLGTFLGTGTAILVANGVATYRNLYHSDE